MSDYEPSPMARRLMDRFCANPGRTTMNDTVIPAAEPVTASPSQRQDILSLARDLTFTPTDPRAITAAAAPLLAWVNQGRDKDDIRVRVRALGQQHDGYGARVFRHLPAAEAEEPGSFLRAAQVLYAFATETTKDI